MGKLGLGWCAGCLALGISFWLQGFTPQVTIEQTRQAESVCKAGEWITINYSSILCKDGATIRFLNKPAFKHLDKKDK